MRKVELTSTPQLAIGYQIATLPSYKIWQYQTGQLASHCTCSTTCTSKATSYNTQNVLDQTAVVEMEWLSIKSSIRELN